ncbi:hypothetical protein APS67_006650 [Streptomyces sp. AVP053U2]|uniref:hypothetical protein n=1 Tax=Streptomyces sp. KMM 9044 TaxID=2744474 RepID=UPI0005AB1C12|nr:hypothetical protein APS67_006650 [Streptomyces sp. AVP053U2]
MAEPVRVRRLTDQEGQKLQQIVRRGSTNARHPDVLAAQRKERARIRSEKGIRWGGRPFSTAV